MEELDESEAAEEYNDQPIATIKKVVNEDGTLRSLVRARKSVFVHNLLHLNGAKFDLSGRDYILPVYDSPDKNIILKTGRQVEKSSFLANNLVISSVVVPYQKNLYVSPSHTQTRQFSSEKLKPLLEQSPLIQKYLQSSSCSAMVFEKGFTNGSFIFLRSAFRSADRCLPAGTQVLMADGSHKAIQDVRVGDIVVSYDGVAPTLQRVAGIQFNGAKATAAVVLTTGHRLPATLNHRFVTDSGIKRLDQMSPDDYVPVPLDYLRRAGPNSPLYEWFGLMLSDGSWRNTRLRRPDKKPLYNVRFCNNDERLLDHFVVLSRQLGFKTCKRTRHQPTTNYTVGLSPQTRSRALLDPYRVLGTGSFDKFIPEVFFQDRTAIQGVLRGLFEGDGWVTYSKKMRQAQIGFVSGSERLARGVQRALQSLGIRSILETKQPRGRQKHVYYVVSLRNTTDIVKFYHGVGLLFKQEKLSKCVAFINTLLATSARENDVPARKDCLAAIKKAGLSCHTLWVKHRISFRSNAANQRTKISVHKVRKIHGLTGDPSLLKWLDPSVCWAQVKSIVESTVEPTYDLEVERDHVFCANGLFTHNTRGISVSGCLTLDELQDFVTSEIPVILECTSHYPNSEVLMAGTPKSHDNTIETYWQSSTQNEWLVKCLACNHYNFLDETNIAPTTVYLDKTFPPGPICKKCQKPIDATTGRWFTFSPGKNIKGYRISQLMVPWIIGLDNQWQKLLWKRDNYPAGQFQNEVLGISHDNASKPITRDELIGCCDAEQEFYSDPPNAYNINHARSQLLIGGVDWGSGLDGADKSPSGKIRHASYTVLTLGYYEDQKHFRVAFIKKYTGAQSDPHFVIQDIVRLCMQLNVHLLGVDWGFGFGLNNELVRQLSFKRVVQFQYLPKMKERAKYDPIGAKYLLQRNLIISELFYELKHGHIRFPAWKQFETYAQDFLGIYCEYIDYQRQIKYDHRPSDPDDAFHSLLYCWQAASIFHGKRWQT